MNKRILTGLQPTGVLTLGNYIGTIIQLLQLQEEGYELFIEIANLHSLTLPYDKDELEKNTWKLLKLFHACGLDKKNTHIFVQSDVSEHTELAYILLCNSTIDELKKMTQFKEKGAKGIKQANNTILIPTGLLTYPTLQASDILLYNVDLVPIGADQKQHLELTRNLAQRINKKFKTNIVIPKPLIKSEGSRIMSLVDPTKKMSKSSTNKKATIFLLDEINDVRKKINSSLTDNENKVYYNKENKPGVSNLIEIYASLNLLSIKEAEEKLKNLNYKEFKDEVFKTIEKTLNEIQDKYQKLNDQKILEKLQETTKYVKKNAKNNLQNIKNKIGLKYGK